MAHRSLATFRLFAGKSEDLKICVEFPEIMGRGTLEGADHRNTAENIDKYRNTAKKIGKYRNTASKVDEIPKSQKRGILFTLCSPAAKNCVV